MKKNEIRSGSALVIVLGMTAVLMMMAIAFSVLMRTERSGMTNLKHALTARQTTHTAIARVMAAIDESFEHPTNNWPIAGWDPPYISSWANSVPGTQYWQNASITALTDRKRNARLLTDELSQHLSPSQRALIKNAKVDWVTVDAGVGASEFLTQKGPKNDMTIARYAFLAFNTTGLLDMNTAPMTNGTDIAKQAAIAKTGFISFLETEGDGEFIARRTALGGYSSYAEMWRALMGKKPYPYEKNKIIAADLFNSFSVALDEVDPDGKMKLFIPKGTAGKTFKSDSEKSTYAKLALERFERMFKDEKAGSSGLPVKLAASPLPELTRAELATQALIDYIDEDDKPDGGIWKSGENPLNYPCTENVPMISQAYSGFEVSLQSEEKPVPTDPTTWYQVYQVTLAVSCRAQYFGSGNMPTGYSLSGEFQFHEFYDLVPEVWANSGPTPERMVYIGGRPWVGAGGLTKEEREAFAETIVPMQPRGGGPKVLGIAGNQTFEVRLYPKTTTTDPAPAVLSWHAFTLPEAAGDLKPVFVQVRVSAKVTSATDGVVQQVPAPGFPPPGSGFAGTDYRLRVNAGIHPKRSGGGGEPYAYGWALCVDPRFAYNTRSVETYPGEGYITWITSEMCSPPDGSIVNENRPDYAPMKEVAVLLTDLEAAGTIMGTAGEQNHLIKRVVFRNFGAPGELSSSRARKLMNAFANRQTVFPDLFHAASYEGEMFIDKTVDNKELEFDVANAPMRSRGEFGKLLIGPWETLSLFATFAPGAATGSEKKVDFHRVSDYFSMNEARFPKIAELPAGGLDGIPDEYLPAIHSGKLNLNPQLKVICDDAIAGSGKLLPAPGGNLLANANEDPLAVLLASASIDEGGPSSLSFLAWKTEAARFYNEVAISGQQKYDPIDMFRYTSDIGNVNVASNLNPVLSAIIEIGSPPPTSDAERERFLGSVLDRLTTRGQTYLVVIRADAYSPKYGSVNALGGTTLASEYALVELWRDSEPNRFPNGDYYPDKTAKDLPAHGWFIRSCRFLSP